MSDLLKLEEFLLLEKRIAQISTNIEIVYSFDVIKTQHAEERSDFSKRNLEADNQYHISNREMSEFIAFFKREISEGIATGQITNDSKFAIKSLDRELSMIIAATEVSLNYWKLIIITVFRESENHQLRVQKGIPIYNK